MGCHMKTTIEIADDLFLQAQKLAKAENRTFRDLTEQGLRQVLNEKATRKRRLPPLTVVGGKGLSEEFKGAPWDKIRDTIYSRE
jgi:hypothetical protein